MMRWFPKLPSWSRRKQELSEELEAHLRMAVEERITNGVSPRVARAAALKDLGNLPLIEDVAREQWGWLWLEHAIHDARYALRRLRRAPGFTITVLLTLAFGIGANLAVFQLLHSVILAKLPIAHPEEIVAVHAAKTPFDQAWMVSYDAYHRLRTATANDAPLAARTGFEEAILQLTGNDTLQTRYELASENLFSVLGVRPVAGRLFISGDATASHSEWPTVVRYDFARNHFGSAPQAVGRHIRLNGVPAVVVGVADPRFAGMITGYAPDFWLPLEAQAGNLGAGFDSLGSGHGIDLDRSWLDQPGIFWLSLVARVPVDRRQAVAAKWNQVFRTDRELMAEATEDPVAKASLLRDTVQIIPAEHGLGGIRQRSARPLYLLMALSASIFLVGCLNLANLQVARLSTREHELGIRMALGANRWRLVGQILIEDAILVLLGGAAAFLVGRTASAILVHWASSRDWLLNIDLDPSLPVAALGIALMVFALGAFSILPALYFIRTSLAQAAGSRAKVAGLAQTGMQRWRANAILATQVSLSLLLTVMSACFAGTLVHWETIDLGMDREHVLSVHLEMRKTGYIDRHHDWIGLYRQVQQRLEALPEVRAASVEMCPMPQCGWNTALYVFGRSGLSNAQEHGEEDHVGPGFFTTMGIPLLRGRDFATTDTDKTQTVAILSRSYARQLFGDENPIGHRVGYEPAPNDHKFLIVGEVADAHVDGPQAAAPPVVYMSIDQHPFPVHAIQVRTAGNPLQIAGRIRAAIRQVDTDLPITEIVPLATEMNDNLGTEKLLARLASIYAGLTLLLVGIGFYGVMLSRTSRRKSEFGIRLALGASRQQIRMLVVKQTASILLAGIVPGLLLSYLAIRMARHLLFGSPGANYISLVGAALVLIMAGLLASIIPSRRAGLADPLETLRSE
jgi:predicted permease